jgi:uncharacterized membrane protein YphA (DoxX/SURF4 family)
MRLNRGTVDTFLLSAVRILLGLMWLQNVGWKQPPDFPNTERVVQLGVNNPTLPPYSDLLGNVVLPNIELFGWAMLAVEMALSVGLLFGIATRLMALTGAVSGLAIGLTVASVPGEWGWSYWLIVGAHLAVYASPSAGRVGGLDAALRQRWSPSSRVGGLYHRWAS